MPLLCHMPPRLRVDCAHPRYPRAASTVLLAFAACTAGRPQAEQDAGRASVADAQGDVRAEQDASSRTPVYTAGGTPHVWASSQVVGPPPSAKVTLSSLEVEGGIGNVRDTVTRILPKLRECFQQALQVDPANGTTTVDFNLRVQDGRVTASSVSTRGNLPGRERECISGAARGLAFDRSESGRIKFRSTFEAVRGK